jgi:hypothetical protein
LEVRIGVPGNTTFKLRTIASGGGNACTYSDLYQFGNGSDAVIPKDHAKVNVRFLSNAAYNNRAALYYLAIEAFDYPIAPVDRPTVLADRFVGERLLFPLTPQDLPLAMTGGFVSVLM